MRKYEAIVMETRVVKMRYVVEAKSKQDAQEKLESGETEFEEEIRDEGVINREVTTEPTLVPKGVR